PQNYRQLSVNPNASLILDTKTISG
ncbi:uncharacterized protein METZ01_LOCUS194359, partial [marine metagenome]